MTSTSRRPFDIATEAAAAARSVDGVVDLDAGPLGEFATWGSGRRCPGVRIRDRDPLHLVVRIVSATGRVLPSLAAAVREAVTEALQGPGEVVVDVHVASLRGATQPRRDPQGAPDPAPDAAASRGTR